MDFRVLVLAFVPLLTGCSELSSPSEQDSTYFNNPKFIEETAARLSFDKAALQKQLSTAGKTEQNLVTVPDWPKEFALMAKTNLNAPALKGMFDLDSIPQKSGYKIVYTALRDNMSIRKFIQCCDNSGKTLAVQCLQQEHSLITRQTIEWRLVADSGYYYRGSDQIKGVNDLTYSIAGSFIPLKK